MRLAVVVLTFLVAALCVVSPLGEVTGNEKERYWEFLGIPFAHQPTRFTPPVDWEESLPASPFLATSFGAACPQEKSQYYPEWQQSEDCLFLNIFTPSVSADATLPVMVYIHGGSFIFGASNVMNGSALAEDNNVVVVTINYRLGIFGWLTQGTGTGNYGLLDQLSALRWVQRNIAAFGGDPEKVMLFGESAGAICVCSLLVAPSAKGLFSSVLVESGDCEARPLSELDALTKGAIKRAGCSESGDVLSCLRNLGTEDVVAAQDPGGFDPRTWWTAVDGVVLPEYPETLLALGQYNKVTIVAGTNANEGTMFIPTSYGPITPMMYTLLLSFVPGLDVDTRDEVRRLYPVVQDGDNRDVVAALIADLSFVCPTSRLLRLASQHGSNTFMYQFQHRSETSQTPVWWGAYHASELQYLFNIHYPARLGATSVTAKECWMGRAMGRYWATVAATSTTPNPKAAGMHVEMPDLSNVEVGSWDNCEIDFDEGAMPIWPKYEAQTKLHLDINVSLSVGRAIHRPKCEFWDRVAASRFDYKMTALGEPAMSLKEENSPAPTSTKSTPSPTEAEVSNDGWWSIAIASTMAGLAVVAVGVVIFLLGRERPAPIE